MNNKFLLNISFFLSLLLLASACGEDEYSIPELSQNLQNDAIKRSIGPNIVGSEIDFAYAMALPASRGKIISAQVEASIPGASGTFLENNAYHTDPQTGADAGRKIGEPSITTGAITKVDFSIDTFAVTLRYKYIIPEEARGKSVNFTFSALGSNGQEVSYSMGPYDISEMDMVHELDLVHGSRNFISIADLAVYNIAQAVANPEKVDLVYLYHFIPNQDAPFFHAIVAPTADAEYRPGVVIPNGVNNNTKIKKAWKLQDRQLANLQYGIYIDDLDFQELDMTHSANYAINLKNESGLWVETADGKYRAYIYMNSTNMADQSAVISIKRYQMY